MSDAIRFPLVLFLITAICGAVLAGLFQVTRGPIAEAQKAKKEKSLKEIFGDEVELGDPLTASLDLGGDKPVEVEYYKVELDGMTYYATIGTSDKCYTSSVPIQIMVGASFSQDGEPVIKRIAVVKSAETPGLGEEIKAEKKSFYLTDIFKDKKETDEDEDKRVWLSQFNDETMDQIALKRSGGKIDAVAGATITSHAVVLAVRQAVERLKLIREQEASAE
ncbi:MAG: RnfABCDGE type electron transport complex subunit G [Planctomycetota bacterium]|nr:RnfABCDGE type electron transport complex subunit G [Planctomycetota bacterium]